MIKYNLLEESNPSTKSYDASEPTSSVTQYYQDTKVTISDIPGFESRYNKSVATSPKDT